MKSFTIEYQHISPVDINNFSDVEIIMGNNGITDFFDGAIYFWRLYIVDGAGDRFYFDEVYSGETAEKYREKLLEVIKSGKKLLRPKDFPEFHR